VSLTLPAEIVASLRAFDSDLSRAVVRIAHLLDKQKHSDLAELAVFGDSNAVILVPPTRALTRHTGAQLVPLWDGRAILALRDDLSVELLELRLGDALRQGVLLMPDRKIFEQLVLLLANTRCRSDLRLKRRSILVVDRLLPAKSGPKKLAHAVE
jgi:hypothetical protein